LAFDSRYRTTILSEVMHPRIIALRSGSVLILLTALFAAAPALAQTVTTIGRPFEGSGDVALGPDGMIYVGDFGEAVSPTGINGEEVLRFTLDGEMEIFATGFQGASGNEFDAHGNLYQSDIRHARIVRITPDGTATTFIEGDLRAPVGLTFDADGYLYVCECNTNRITRATPDGSSFEPFVSGDPFNCPNGITTGPDGNLYVVNFSDGSVIRTTLPDGESEVIAVLPGGGNGHITSANGRLYAVSYTGHRVYEISLDGDVRAIAGTGEPGSADGPAAEATFFLPNGIAASVTGDTLYVNSTAPPNDEGIIYPSVLRMITGVRSGMHD
jgi:sugar lactone lactonase YvrE